MSWGRRNIWAKHNNRRWSIVNLSVHNLRTKHTPSRCLRHINYDQLQACCKDTVKSYGVCCFKRGKPYLKYSNFRCYSWNYLRIWKLGKIWLSTSGAYIFRAGYEDADSRFLQNVCASLTNYRMLRPRRCYALAKPLILSETEPLP